MEVTDRIERLEAFEDRLGVTLDALFAQELFREGACRSVSVLGELRVQNGTKLEWQDEFEEIRVEAVAYDEGGHVVGVALQSWYKKDIFAFQPFQLDVFITNDATPARIRVYPK